MPSEIGRIMRWPKGTRRKRIAVSLAHVLLWPVLLIPRLLRPRRGGGFPQSGRILLIRMDGIGDLSMSGAAIASLRRRYPGARIDLLTSHVAEPIAGLMAARGWIDHVHVMPLLGRRLSDYRAMIARFAQTRYDASIDLRGDARTNLLMWLSGVPQRIGLAGSGLTYLLTDIIEIPAPHHQADECAELLRRVGVTEIDPFPRLPLQAGDIEAAERWLQEQGWRADQPMVAMHLGAFTATKLWPLERFLEVATRLRDHCNAQVLLVGGGADVELCGEFAGRFGRPVMISAGRASLPMTAALLSRCAVMIGNDSGPAHVAACVGCPVVVMFGPGSPALYRPLSPRVAVMKSPRECEVGCERVCARPEAHCMLDHTVDAVVQAAEAFIHPREPASSR